MRPKARQSAIVDLLREQGQVTVDELSTRFQASSETIRRDLSLLANDGKLLKNHGGASLPRNMGEGLFAQRMQENLAAKRKLARLARLQISSGDTLFIDTGSTTLIFAEELSGLDNLTVITNSSAIARTLLSVNPNTRVYLVGGSYNLDNQQTRGAMALEQIDRFDATIAVIAAGAVNARSGIMDYDIAEAEIAQRMVARAEKTMVLADSSKFDRSAPHIVAPWQRIDSLVCERQPTATLGRVVTDHEVAVVC